MTGQPVSRRDADLTAKARIRYAALALYAEKGFGITIREIADRAGVSSGLITFHFGTKEALRTTVEEMVFEQFWEVIHAGAGDASAAEQARRRAMVDALRHDPALVGFFRHVILDDSPQSHDFILRLAQLESSQLAEQQVEGTTRQVDDPEMVAFLITALHIGLLTLVPVLEHTLQAPFLSNQVLDRWFDAQYDLLTNGLFRDSKPKMAATRKRHR